MGSFQPDQFDLAILEVVQEDGALSHREIGERVNLSAASVHRRIRRLEDENFITSNVAVVDPAKVGRPIAIVVEVRVESEKLRLLDGTRRRFRDHPDVQQCYYVTGEADFVLVVNVASMDHYDALTRELFHGDPNVTRFRSLVVMNKVKVGLGTPVRPIGNEKSPA
ncbi:Lrp/AsnC family transcriptional regulator [Hansschlegelia sp.]|uniref:Lrp/AsnC family transcriptional regulator n=1 Tax=Hansschlegelia sp. TaxID=2041892 RepID=UPI002C1409F5|nr:Lrp/AsnC family transcriptional regulator [Hansschlegelia sp.]HVI27083.1 Lrp/AsnC family transcriptional regulator [Hansschlegelia sp.]